jgi:hypothetical protein
MAHFYRQHALKLEPTQQIALRLLRARKQPGFGGRELRQQFTKLSELDQGSIRIIPEIPFRQSAEPHKLRIMLG